MLAFKRAWNLRVSPGNPLFHQHLRAQALLELERGSNSFGISTQMRVLWK